MHTAWTLKDHVNLSRSNSYGAELWLALPCVQDIYMPMELCRERSRLVGFNAFLCVCPILRKIKDALFAAIDAMKFPTCYNSDTQGILNLGQRVEACELLP